MFFHLKNLAKIITTFGKTNAWSYAVIVFLPSLCLYSNLANCVNVLDTRSKFWKLYFCFLSTPTSSENIADHW